MNYIIMHNDRTRRQEENMVILMRNNIKFYILEMCSSIDTEYEDITIRIKDFQISIIISTIVVLSSNLSFLIRTFETILKTQRRM